MRMYSLAQNTQGAESLAGALAKWEASTGKELLYRATHVFGKKSGCTIQPQDATAALSCLLQNTGLAFRTTPDGIYILYQVPPPPPEKARIVGKIVHAQSKLPLEAAHIQLKGYPIGSVSNGNGKFFLTDIDAGSYQIKVSYLGFNDAVIPIELKTGEERSLAIELEEKTIQITPLVIDGMTEVWDSFPLTGIDGIALKLSRNAGSPDVLGATNTIMGVQINDVLGEVHIQGGNSGEHQLFLDGMPVYEPIHLRGLVSMFSPFALSEINVYKAGYDVRHGSYLSGVIEAKHNNRYQNHKPHQVEVQIDPISANARYQYQKTEANLTKFQVMVAGRVDVWSAFQPISFRNLIKSWSVPDLFLPNATLLSVLEDQPNVIIRRLLDTELGIEAFDQTLLDFTDVHATSKLNLGLGKQVSASFYRGKTELSGTSIVSIPSDPEAVPIQNRDSYRWQNVIGKFEYQQLLTPSVLTKISVNTSQYKLAHDFNTLARVFQRIPLADGRIIEVLNAPTPADNGNQFGSFTQKIGFEGTRKKMVWESGFESQVLNSHFVFEEAGYQPINSSLKESLLIGYLWVQYNLTSKLSIDGGIRSSKLGNLNSVFNEPRVRVSFQDQDFKTSLAMGKYYQLVNRFEISSFSPSALLPSVRFWLPLDGSMIGGRSLPPNAFHLAGTASWSVNNMLQLDAEGYWKRQQDLLEIDYATLWGLIRQKKTVNNQNEFLHRSGGYAYGGSVGMKLQGKLVDVTGLYEVSHATRKSERKFQGTSYTTQWNIPHQVQGSMFGKWKNFGFNLQFRALWGRAWGFRKAYYDYLASDDIIQAVYGDFDLKQPNNHKLPPLVQTDMGFSYHKQLRNSKMQLRIDILNVLNHKNVIEWQLEQQEENGVFTYEINHRYLQSITPTFALRYSL